MKNTLKVLGCVSPYCNSSSNCPGYIYSDGINNIMLDCGPGICRQLNMPNDLNNLSIFISHLHKDHYSEIFSLGYASYCYHRMGMLNERIKLYIPKMFPGEDGYDDYMLIMNNKDHFFEIVPYDINSKIRVGDANISFFENKHSIRSYSTKIEAPSLTMVYTGDMGFSNIDRFVEFCEGCDVLLSEATYLDCDNTVDENHLHAKEAAYIASLVNVKELILTHFWPEHEKMEYVAEATSVFSNVEAADENIIIDLNEIIKESVSHHR